MTTNKIEQLLRATYASSDLIVSTSEESSVVLPVAPAWALDEHGEQSGWFRPLVAAAVIGVVALGGTVLILDNQNSNQVAAPAVSASPISSSTGPPSTAVGASFPFVLASHCGIDFVEFGGDTWRAEKPLPEPVTRPDAQGNVGLTGYTPGTMTLDDEDTLRFVIDDRAVTATTRIVLFHRTNTKPPLCD